MLNKIDFSPGKITYDEFKINPEISFDKQVFLFKEDLFQVTYGDKYLIDVGWYPEIEKNGLFQIVIVKNYDWDNPFFFKKTKNFKELYSYVEECSQIVRELLQNEK